jgi:hypothetical protein
LALVWGAITAVGIGVAGALSDESLAGVVEGMVIGGGIAFVAIGLMRARPWRRE